MPEIAAQYKSIAQLTQTDKRMPAERFAYQFTKLDLSSLDFQALYNCMEYIGWQQIAEDCRTQLDLDEVAKLLIEIFNAAKAGGERAIAIRQSLWVQINAQPKDWVKRLGDRMTEIAGNPNPQPSSKGAASKEPEPAQPTGDRTVTHELVYEAWRSGQNDAATLFRYFYGELEWWRIGEALEREGQEKVFAFMLKIWRWIDEPDCDSKEKSFKESIFTSIWSKLPQPWSSIFQRSVVNPILDQRNRDRIARAEEAKRLRDEAELAEYQELEKIRARIFDKNDRYGDYASKPSVSQSAVQQIETGYTGVSALAGDTSQSVVQQIKATQSAKRKEVSNPKGTTKTLISGKNAKWVHTPTELSRFPKYMLGQLTSLAMEGDRDAIDDGIFAGNALYGRFHQESPQAGWDDVIVVRKTQWREQVEAANQLSESVQRQMATINELRKDLADAKHLIEHMESTHADQLWLATKASQGGQSGNGDDDDGYQGYSGYSGYNGYDPSGSGGVEVDVENDYYAQQ